MSDYCRFVAAAMLPVSALLERAGLRGALLAEATAIIEGRSFAGLRGAVAPPVRGGETPGVPRRTRAIDAAAWLSDAFAASVIRAEVRDSRTDRNTRTTADLAPLRAALALQFRRKRELVATLGVLRELIRDDRVRSAEVLARTDVDSALVHVPIDLEHTFGRTSRIDFTEQLLRARELMRWSAGRVLPVVPFDPKRPAAIAIVREAMSRGFVGVSLELRGGVRFLENGTSREGRDLDLRLHELYAACIAGDIPVVVPCVSAFDPDDDFDARRRLDDLKSLLARSRYRSLRICIAGAGSLEGWDEGVRGGKKTAFAKSDAGFALAIAAAHRNVYCDMTPSKQLDAAQLEKLVTQALALRSAGTSRPSRLRRKLMLGSLIACAHGDVAATLRSRMGPASGVDDLLRGNAIEFFRLREFATAAPGLDEAEQRTVATIAGLPATDKPAAPRKPARRGTRATTPAATRTTTGSPGLDPAEPVDCIVLGAGISGVTAARNIAASRSSSGRPLTVLVLEGSNRVGGRMHTLRNPALPIPVELGAELIHRPESEQNSGGFRIWEEVHRYGIETRAIDKNWSNYVWFRNWTTDPAGPKLRGGFGACLDMDVGYAKSALSAVMSWRLGPDRSAKNLRDRVLADVNRQSANAEDMADYLMSGTVPGELDELSVAGLKSDRVKDQEFSAEEYHVAQGYDSVPRAIAGGLPIEFGAVVERVEWWKTNAVSGVRVQTRDGRVFHGKSAVCTFSVGVLRDSGIQFARVAPDVPREGLPATKLAAIERIGFGRESKLVMQFTHRFWPEDMAILSTPGRGQRAGRSFFNPSYNAPGSPAIITAFLTRTKAKEFDDLTAPDAERWKGDGKDETAIETFLRTNVLADLLEILDDFLKRPGAPAAPRPQDVLYWHARAWGNDPLVLGGTSFLRFKAGTSQEAMSGARAALADASETRPLFWAGEATAVGTNPWSVHGAHMSGRAAALAVVASM